ncbi:hypothetical protein LMG27952_02765 [Paraburkholderia hiiakae]|uniref:Zinc ribbon domain-containing protein n=1 Tax=Paraburkholderia hiiakae TaxID=1081782 RepID=A0ABN7HST5_9BURK|nr:hypothetical protein [Paraburkholderia hiiakae]CAD6533524.1 hypothetical protein LMG27952_02765 [Paraburkholderia hiiakae]
MLNAPGHGDSGPSECPYCGTRFNAPLALCPQCGANQLAAAARIAEASEGAPGERAHGVTERLRANFGTLPGSLGGNRGYDGEYPSIDEEHIAERSRLPRFAWAGLGVLAVAFAGYAFLHRSDWEPKLGAQVVMGSVIGSKGTPGTLAALTSRPPAGPPRTNAAQHKVAQQNAPAVERAPASPRYVSAHPEVARDLASARASLDKNTLWPARRSLMNALAVEPGNPDAQRMQADLVAREQQRDALIGQARQCAHARQWACVRQDAGHAVNVDASSREARHLLALASAERRPGAGKRNGWPWPWESQYAQTGDTHSHQAPLFWHH